MTWYENIHQQPTSQTTNETKSGSSGVLRANGRIKRAVQNIRMGANYADGSHTNVYGSAAKGGLIGGFMGLVVGLITRKYIFLSIAAGAGVGSAAGVIANLTKENKALKEQ